MLFWIREAIGWLLVLGGLFVFLLCLSLAESRKTVEAAIAAGIGLVTFRGGIHLIKVATAARIVLQLHKQRQTQVPDSPHRGGL